MSAAALPLGVLLSRPGHEAAQLALMAATAAAAIGRPAVLFCTQAGVHLLRADAPLADDAREALATARGVAGTAELLEAARALDIRLIACDAALRMEGIAPDRLAAGVEVAGLVTFLSAVGAGPVVSP